LSAKDLTKEAKKPDQFRLWLSQALDQAVKHAKLIMGAFVAFIVIGGALAGYQYFQQSKEAGLQERYSALEKELVDKRRAFDEAEQQARLAANAKPGDKAPESKAVPPSGDLAKDYGDLPARLEALVNEAPKSAAAEMAALSLAELRLKYKDTAGAFAALQQVNTKERTSDLTGALIVNLKAAVLADQGQCAAAVPLWEKLGGDARAGFLHGEARLRMGLCFESMNDLAKAEQTYQGLATREDASKDAATVINESVQREAERYLRLLRMKKARGS
jgi:predicted negative regulator of RcsB-dependent stress response